jgi:hypothetical protein
VSAAEFDIRRVADVPAGVAIELGLYSECFVLGVYSADLCCSARTR